MCFLRFKIKKMSNTNNKSVFVYLFGSIIIIQMMLDGHFHIRVHVKIFSATSVFVPWLALSSFLVPNSLLFPIIPPTPLCAGKRVHLLLVCKLLGTRLLKPTRASTRCQMGRSPTRDDWRAQVSGVPGCWKTVFCSV